MFLFDIPDATFYCWSIINIDLSGSMFEFFGSEKYRDVELGVRGNKMLLKPMQFDS